MGFSGNMPSAVMVIVDTHADAAYFIFLFLI